MIKRKGKKGQLEWDSLIPWIVGIGVLILVLFIYLGLKDKGVGALDYFKCLIKACK